MANTVLLYSESDIQKRISELAEEIASDYKDKDVVLVGILKGSFVFLADLQRELYRKGLVDTEVDFMTVSSYGKSKEHQGSVILQDISLDLMGKEVLIVDDIVDTGHTLTFVKSHLFNKSPRSFNIVTLLDKKEKREVEIDVKYIGFSLDGSPWVEGYGLDGGLFGRGRPEIVTMA